MRLAAGALIVGMLWLPPTLPALASPATCPLINPGLEGPPPDLPPLPDPGITLPVRNDPDGGVTVTLAVEDPADPAGERFSYSPLSSSGVGVYSHRWPTQRPIYSLGLYQNAAAGLVRLPVLLAENPTSPDDLLAIVGAELSREESSAFSIAGRLLLTEVVSSATGLGTSAPHGAPSAAGYDTPPPTYIWTTFRRAPRVQFWSGLVMMHNGQVTTTSLGDASVIDACRRTRIGLVARTVGGAEFLGGMFFLEEEVGTTGADVASTSDTAQTITAGTTAGAGQIWTDVALTVQQFQHRRGAPMFGTQPTRSDHFEIGPQVDDQLVPIIGGRAEASIGDPPLGSQQVSSLGVFDPEGTYHPLVGQSERSAGSPGHLNWLMAWYSAGGFGEQSAGAHESDAGVFDAGGSFVPLAGSRYSISFAGGIFPYQAMLDVGPWVAGFYAPLVGATYDGGSPLLPWPSLNTDGWPLPPWITSVGVFSPLGSYVPVVGASFNAPLPPPAPVREEYRVGVFIGDYPAFVPIAGTRWTSSLNSGFWVMRSTGSNVPADASLDVGAYGVDGSFLPVVGMHARSGNPQRATVGAWLAGEFVPAFEMCRSNGFLGEYGVGAFGIPIAYAGLQNGQPVVSSGDCPSP